LFQGFKKSLALVARLSFSCVGAHDFVGRPFIRRVVSAPVNINRAAKSRRIRTAFRKFRFNDGHVQLIRGFVLARALLGRRQQQGGLRDGVRGPF